MPKKRYGHRHGAVHKQVKRRFRSEMDRGVVYVCWGCGDESRSAWDLGHVEPGIGSWLDFKGHMGRWPEHRHARDCKAGGNRATMTHVKQGSPRRSRRRVDSAGRHHPFELLDYHGERVA